MINVQGLSKTFGELKGVDGLRAALVDLGHIGIALDAGVLAVIASIFLVLGAWSFSRIQI